MLKFDAAKTIQTRPFDRVPTAANWYSLNPIKTHIFKRAEQDAILQELTTMFLARNTDKPKMEYKRAL